MLNRRAFMSALGIASSTVPAFATEKSPQSPAQQLPPIDIPSADDLAGNWVSFADVHAQPAVSSTRGACQVGTDMLSVEYLCFPPFSQGPQGSGVLTVDGQVLRAAEYRWYPYQVIRRCHTWDGTFEIQSSVRLGYAENIVLYRLSCRNLGTKAANIQLAVNPLGVIRQFNETWQWAPPRPQNPADFKAEWTAPGLLCTSDSQSPAVTAFAIVHHSLHQAAVKQNLADVTRDRSVPAGQSKTVDMVMAVGDDRDAVCRLAAHTAAEFEHAFRACKNEWQKIFNASFTPGNAVFSGHLPILRTNDAAVRRCYYSSIASLLCSLRTCFPGIKRAYVTGAPQDAVSLMYFWDTFTWAEVYALLDPAIMRDMLVAWLKLNIHNCYAQDMLSGKGVGPWYSFNDYCVFSLILKYVRLTGDHQFLLLRVGDRPVIDQLEQMAFWWKRLVKPHCPLADYGARWNLLECVPTYTHVVASLNAANVWMMRQTASLRQELGQHTRAITLEKQADQLARQVLKLYVRGRGYWYTMQPSGQKIPVRHCIDFFTVTMCMKEDLSPATQREMAQFVTHELLTSHWMRALSLADYAAPESNRPDHGPMGAYTAWPPFTMAALGHLGHWNRAASFLRATAETARQGPFGQSDELLTAESHAPVRKASRGGQMYFCSCSGAFAATIIGAFFGLTSVGPAGVKLSDPGISRQIEGELSGIGPAGQLWNISSGKNGLKAIKPSKKAGEGI